MASRLWAVALLASAAALLVLRPAPAVVTLQIMEPLDGAMFPPEFPATRFEWVPGPGETAWRIEVRDANGTLFRKEPLGEPLPAPVIDPLAISETNRPPQVDGARRCWRPEEALWAEIKRRSVESPATVIVTGLAEGREVSHAEIRLRTSRDPVGAPIFYRDVPLMPTEVEKGVIKPIVPSAVPLIAWRLRDVSRRDSRLLMRGLPTCANCHSFSRDGGTIALDVDGPQNDKGMYAMARLEPHARVETSDVFTWNDFTGKPEGHRTIGFIAQASPDGRYSVTTVNEDVFVANFKDYGFLQVFFPTRGILAVYDRETKKIRALPGADNPSFVQSAAFWSADGEWLYFSRAVARDAYPAGRPMALYANDPNEPQIQYDLYRIPFHHGKGGIARPVAGASKNGMSNSFPKPSPDGKWVVWVQAKNGLLMRPDGQLYIAPAEGGTARRLRANTARMNSWHSWSPNSRWLVFASKSRGPYTQLLLTHIDENGGDTPAVLLEETTAANRAANLPEFVNRAYSEFLSLEIPAADFYRVFDTAFALMEKGRWTESIAEWERALALKPEDSKAHNNLGRALAGAGRLEEAVGHWRRALALNDGYTEARNNLAAGLLEQGQPKEAMEHLERLRDAGVVAAEVEANYGRALRERGKVEAALKPLRRAVELNPKLALTRFELGHTLLALGQRREALAEFRAGIRLNPSEARALAAAARILSTSEEAGLRSGPEALMLADRAVEITKSKDAAALGALAGALAELGRFPEAREAADKASAAARSAAERREAERILKLVQAGQSVRER